MADPASEYRRSLQLSFLTSMKYTGLTDGKYYLERFERMLLSIIEAPKSDTEILDLFTCTLSEDLPSGPAAADFGTVSTAQWFDSLPPSAKRDWPTFKKRFVDRWKRGAGGAPMELKEAVERLQKIKMEDGSSLEGYLNEFAEAYEDLGGKDSQVGSDLAISIMLKNLGPEEKVCLNCYEAARRELTGGSWGFLDDLGRFMRIRRMWRRRRRRSRGLSWSTRGLQRIGGGIGDERNGLDHSRSFFCMLVDLILILVTAYHTFAYKIHSFLVSPSSRYTTPCVVHKVTLPTRLLVQPPANRKVGIRPIVMPSVPPWPHQSSCEIPSTFREIHHS